ncbi:MAG: hypothetical protein LBQ15_02975 [Clostridium sp.]|jgi:hypothetical protein|nr:hypothetical protein [Clostridium sp.]
MQLSKERADALCAIIALGFVGQNQREDRTGRTLYLYDSQADAIKHATLQQTLWDSFGINIANELQNAKDATTGRKIHPFIYALPYGNEGGPRRLTYEEVKVNEEEIADIAQITESAANSLITATNRFRGAYIGGFINYTEGKLSLIGPSSLYLRERMYLARNNPRPESVAAMFIDYANVVQETKKFLRECSQTFRTHGAIYENIGTSSDLTEALISEGKPGDDQRILEEGKIFSSCHGLVTSMYYHSDVHSHHLDEGVCVELSLSDDTCKSASCIPCAIFAASQGTPASAVHFGRGDFWNLPTVAIRRSLNPRFEDNWRAFVTTCFVSASHEILEWQFFHPITMQMAGLVGNAAELAAIPEMFLDALTFEGSFIDRMIKYLPIYHPPAVQHT